MYRLEAQGVPNLLKAPIPQPQLDANVTNRSELENGEYGEKEEAEGLDDEQCYYEDGNYWHANPMSYPGGTDSDELLYDDYQAPEEGREEDEDIDPQEAYYESLMIRFTTFRTMINSPPTNIPLPTNSHSLPGYNASYADWENAVLNSSPLAVKISRMEQRHVLQAVTRVEDLLTKKHLLDGQKGRNLGAWCWSLLGRCKDANEMISEEVGTVRGLARRAAGVLRDWRGRAGERSNGMIKQDSDEEEDTTDEEARGLAEDGQLAEKADEVRGTDEHLDSHLSGTSQSDPLHLEDAPSSPFQTIAPEGDPAVLELARQKLMEQLSPNTSERRNGIADPLNADPSNPSYTQAHVYPNGEDGDEGEIVSGDESEDDYEVNELAPDPQIAALATLDMIITIVGEFWGQKDLLVQREIWGERN